MIKAMKYLALLLIGLNLNLIHGYSQNCSSYNQPSCELVKDGSFEHYSVPCASFSALNLYQLFKACFWIEPDPFSNPSTPDIFNSCAPIPTNALQANASFNATLNQWNYYKTGTTTIAPITQLSPRSGSGYAGISVYSFPVSGNNSSPREYLTQNLNQTLIPGMKYTISMWVRLSGNSKYGCQAPNIYLTDVKPSQPLAPGGFQASVIYSGGGGSLVWQATPANIITNKSSWTKLTTIFIPPAGSNYQWITIGNFNYDMSTPHSPAIAGTHTSTVYDGAYFYIDDVSITPPPPQVMLGSMVKSICKGDRVKLIASVPAPLTNYTMNWKPISPAGPDIYNGVPTPVTVSPTVTTVYLCTITDNTTGCSSSFSWTINVSDNDPSFNVMALYFSGGTYYSLNAAPVVTNGNSTAGFGFDYKVEEVTETNPNVFAVVPGTTSNTSPSCWMIYPGQITFSGYNGTANVTCGTPLTGQFGIGKKYRITRATWNNYCPRRELSQVIYMSPQN